MPRRRTLRARARSFCRRSLAFLFSNVGVIILVLGYTIAGAFMFQAIEGAGEMERVNNMVRERDRTANHMWQNITLVLNLFNDTELKLRISSELVRYQRKVVEGARRGWEGGRSSRQWSFSSGFLYSLTVITTIGYGNLSPRTSWGKLATIFYALLGMPLFLLYLSNVGELLARWFKCLYALVCLCRGCPGFTRRRVARLRNQTAEVSEVESIERPERCRRYSSSFDEDPEFQRHNQYNYYHRNPYIRSTSAPYPLRQDFRRTNHDYHRHFSQPNPSSTYSQTHRNYHQYHRYNSRHIRDHRNIYQDHRNWDVSRRNIYHNSRNMYQDSRNVYKDPRHIFPDPRIRESSGHVRELSGGVGWSDQASSSSAFTYITFDAQTITVPISVCVAVMVSYIIFGSMIFGMWEKWDQLDGAYFCFISLSSIGFGDFVPGERVYSEKIETSFIVCSLYLMLGMALVAMCFNLMQEQVIHYFAGLKRALKRICRCKR